MEIKCTQLGTRIIRMDEKEIEFFGSVAIPAEGCSTISRITMAGNPDEFVWQPFRILKENQIVQRCASMYARQSEYQNRTKHYNPTLSGCSNLKLLFVAASAATL